MMRVPRATYRLQLGPGLTFDDAAGLVDYLDVVPNHMGIAHK